MLRVWQLVLALEQLAQQQERQQLAPLKLR
jgi:hypothetical protein